MFNGELTALIMGSIARAKASGPIGSPCWTPRAEVMTVSPKERGVGAEYEWLTKGSSSGHFSLTLLSRTSRLSELTAFLISTLTKTRNVSRDSETLENVE